MLFHDHRVVQKFNELCNRRKPNAPVLQLPKSTIEHRDRSISTLKNNNSIQLSPLNAGTAV